jgi:excisionase family DNA binding protein
MRPDVPYGRGARMLSLRELCEWLNITERHARKLVERDVIPYRKVGHLLRFAESEVEEWSRPKPRDAKAHTEYPHANVPAKSRRSRLGTVLPKSLIELTPQESGDAERRSA